MREVIAERVRGAGVVALFLDFDGTIAEIEEAPALARIDRGIARLIARFATMPRVRCAVVSGRSLADLRGLVPARGVDLVGSHGLEIAAEGYRFTHADSRGAADAVPDTVADLREALADHPDVFLERKEFSVACHYRSAPRPSVPDVQRIIRRVARQDREQWRVLEGKEVLEILPRTDWTKGSAVTSLMSRYALDAASAGGLLPIYFGDDHTDQPAFDAVRQAGISIAVGPREELRADYRLDGVAAVRALLEFVSRVLTDPMSGETAPLAETLSLPPR